MVNILQQGQAGTTLTASVSGVAFLTRTFNWSMTKTGSPQMSNLFLGDTQTITWTIDATRDEGVLASYIEGTVCVTNGGAVATENLTITADLTIPPSQTPIRTIQIIVAPMPVLNPGETYCYPYRFTFAEPPLPTTNFKVTAHVRITNHSGFIGIPFGPNPSASDIFFPSTPTLINRNLTVTDTNGSSFLFTSSGSQSYTTSFTCMNTGTQTLTNTASVSPTSTQPALSSTANVQINCYALEVSKTASTSLTRTYQWAISKTAHDTTNSPIPTVVTLSPGQTYAVNYHVTVTPTSTDSNYAVSGTITVINPAPIPVNATIIDLANGTTSSVATDVVIQPGINTFAYAVHLANPNPGNNVARVTIQNGYVFNSQPVGYNFANPTITYIDDIVTVFDSQGNNLGVALRQASTFTYNWVIGPFNACSDDTKVITNVATFTTNTTGTSGSTSYHINVRVPCTGCTHTIGFWRNHAGLGPQPDLVTKLLPIILGTVGGSKSVLVTSAQRAVELLIFGGAYDPLGNSSIPDAANGINRLYAQLLAAKLNIKDGAIGFSIASTITAADTFLATNNSSNWASLSRPQRQIVLGWATTLDSYNNGIIGPGHCTEVIATSAGATSTSVMNPAAQTQSAARLSSSNQGEEEKGVSAETAELNQTVRKKKERRLPLRRKRKQ